MRDWINHLWCGSIRRQLMLGISLVHAVLMTFFVFDLVARQQEFLNHQNENLALSLSHTLATTSRSWVLANDVVGLEEVLRALNTYPEMRYAMVLSPQGQVMAHSDHQYNGQFVVDPVSQSLLRHAPESTILLSTPQVIDVAAPIFRNRLLVGWARVGLGQEAEQHELSTVIHKGLSYTVVALLIGGVFAWMMARGLTGRLYQLLTVVDATRGGDRKGRVDTKPHNEVGHLAEGINRMLDTLAEEEEARRLSQSRLETAIHHAEEANLAKSIFLANMSHEIRTPMNAILGMADLLWESDLSTEQRKFVQVCRSAGENLMGVINDVLDLSKIEAGHLTLENISFNLAEEMNVVRDIMSWRVSAKGLQLIVYIHPGVPEILMGDPTRLRQIFLNLLSNAVKFTEHGSIRFEAKCDEASQSELATILFRVEDTGIGIEENRLSVIFEEFVQADSSVTRRFGGTGLGLAIVRKLLDKMAGQIHVSSCVGKGTTFLFSVPLKPGESPQALVLPDLSAKRILVVDDQADNRLVFQEYLKPMHPALDEAEDGVVALQKIESANATGSPYHLVLLDVRMPAVSGFQMVELLRASGCSNQLIMMLTSEYQNDDLQRCQELGVQHYLIKPVRRSDLIRAVQHALHVSVETPVLTLPPRVETPKSPLKILLVEDSEENQVLIAAYLDRPDIELQIAENGIVALEMLRQFPFDLVLMDMRMPEMDGYSATRTWRRIEQQQKRPRLPIVALTANAFQEDIDQCLSAGCDIHLAKPVKKRAMFDLIHRLTGEDSQGHPRVWV
ncbi:MAG: response regulator [Magnetococcales bacterium]|nr:response regulator [Magnetococcales bacterium]